MQSLILALAGLVGGFIGSEVGAGAMVTLPILLFIGLPPVAAVAANSISAWLINAIATYEYWKNGKISKDIVWHLAPLSLLGALIGAHLISIIDPQIASAVIAVLFIVVFFVMFILLRKGAAGLKTGSSRYTASKKALAAVLSFGLGVYGGFFAVGVTTLFVMLIVFLLHRDFVRAAADAVAISAVFLLGSLVEFAITGLIQYSYAVPLAIGSALGAYLGSKTALKFGNRWLKGLVMLMVVLVIAKLTYAAVGSGAPLACSTLSLFCN